MNAAGFSLAPSRRNLADRWPGLAMLSKFFTAAVYEAEVLL